MRGLTDALEIIGGLNVLGSDLHEGDVDFIQHLQDTADEGVIPVHRSTGKQTRKNHRQERSSTGDSQTQININIQTQMCSGQKLLVSFGAVSFSITDASEH